MLLSFLSVYRATLHMQRKHSTSQAAELYMLVCWLTVSLLWVWLHYSPWQKLSAALWGKEHKCMVSDYQQAYICGLLKRNYTFKLCSHSRCIATEEGVMNTSLPLNMCVYNLALTVLLHCSPFVQRAEVDERLHEDFRSFYQSVDFFSFLFFSSDKIDFPSTQKRVVQPTDLLIPANRGAPWTCGCQTKMFL